MYLCLVLIFIIAFDLRSVPSVVAKEDPSLFEELKSFTDVLSIVKHDYVEEVGSKKLVEGSIKGLLNALDPHSSYLTPELYKELKVETSGAFGGLGIEITVKDGLIVVVSPIEGSPAERVGIKPGDAIVKINGKYAKDLSLVEAVNQMRGPKGSPIAVAIHRDGIENLLDFTMVRDNIRVKSVRSRMLENGYAYIRLAQFQDDSSRDLKAALDALRDQNKSELKGLILDLRNNPGGLLPEAVKVGDLFIDDGLIVYTDGRVENQKQKFYAHKRGTEAQYPLIVMINGGSASASEIVAGALQDAGRGLVLGTKSFGKGSVQTITPLENGGAVRLTTALYFTRNGRSIQAKGIEPDIAVADKVDPKPLAAETSSGDESRYLKESDLPGAIENPQGGANSEGGNESKKSSEAKKTNKELFQELAERRNLEKMDLGKLLAEDPQLNRAFELLKTYNVFKKI